MADCPKCRGLMTAGFVAIPSYGERVKWIDGDPADWNALAAGFGFGGKAADLASRRCGQCGFVEFFADARAKSAKSMTIVESETERLRGLVTKLLERVAVLETIATDPAQRTSSEIESLRSLPSAKDDKSGS